MATTPPTVCADARGGTVAAMDLGPSELLIILVVALVLFGGAKLPELARSLGKAKSEFEKGTRGSTETAKPDDDASA
jgi:TatA/E family protein of Tat protein translocase